MAFLAARYNLDLLYNRLIVASLEIDGLPRLPEPDQRRVERHHLLGGDGTRRRAGGAGATSCAATTPATKALSVQWLDRKSFDDWESTAPDQETVDGLSAFLGVYGHRAVDEAEMARPRWYEDPVPVMHGLLGVIERGAKQPARTPAGT